MLRDSQRLERDGFMNTGCNVSVTRSTGQAIAEPADS